MAGFQAEGIGHRGSEDAALTGTSKRNLKEHRNNIEKATYPASPSRISCSIECGCVSVVMMGLRASFFLFFAARLEPLALDDGAPATLGVGGPVTPGEGGGFCACVASAPPFIFSW
jgi:hypothetical protein